MNPNCNQDSKHPFNDLSGCHCITQVGVDNQVGGNDYDWCNISKSCGNIESN